MPRVICRSAFWVPKYRKSVLVGPVAVRVRDLNCQVAMSRGLQILSGRSRVLLQEFVHLRGQLRGRHLWAGGTWP